MNILELEPENGRLIVFPEDRAKLKEQAINVTLEDDKVKTLLVGKNQAVSKGETSSMRDNWDKGENSRSLTEHWPRR